MDLAYPCSTKKTTAQFAFIPTHHFNNITRLNSNAAKTINKFTEKPSSADKQSEEKNKAFNHMKRRQPKVRGSPHPWGYVHQKVSLACDIYFVLKKKGVYICN